jgi:predicted aldo/keto reductase-like oxidoreductase
MDEFRSTTGTRFCRQCEYCMPCPQGVHIHRMTYLQRLYELCARVMNVYMMRPVG